MTKIPRKTVSYSCAVCGYSETRKFFSFSSQFSLYRCQNCKLVFVTPKPTFKRNEQNNEEKYDSQQELSDRTAAFAMEYKRAKEHVQEFAKFHKSGKYLDIGCSFGFSVKAAQDFGFDAMGIEPGKRAALYGKRHLEVRILTTPFEKAKFTSNFFSIVSLYDVLEHIPDLHLFLSKIHKILKPGGILVIQSPNIESFAFRFLQRDWNWLLVPWHLWHFSRQSITHLLEENGFSVVRYTTHDVPYDFASNLTSRILSYDTSQKLYKRLVRKAVYLFVRTIITVGSPLWSKMGKGGSILLYATKK